MSGVTVKIDHRINSELQRIILRDMQVHLRDGVLLDSSKFTELKFDSTVFSYLLTVRSRDLLRPADLNSLRAYGTILSSTYLDKAQIHYYSEFNNKYYQHDTTMVISTGNRRFESKRLSITFTSISAEKSDMISKLLVVYTSDMDLPDKLVAVISKDSTLYSMDFILENDVENVQNLRDRLIKLDSSHRYLVFGSDQLLVNFKDTVGTELTRGIYFK